MPRPRTVAVIQARMNSSRLPGKVLLPLAGAPLLQRLIERVRVARALDALVVATTNTVADDPVAALCAEIGVDWYRGDEANVLGRVIGAAEKAGAEVVVRLTADNPFVDAELIDLVTGGFLAANPPVAYSANVDDCGYPYGLFVEVVSMEALRRVSDKAGPRDLEHVTWGIRRNPERFPTLRVNATVSFGPEPLSIDTAGDYERVRAIFEREFKRDPDFSHRALTAQHMQSEAAK